MHIRACTATFAGALEVRSGPEFTGVLAPLLYEFLDTFNRYFSNITISAAGILGSTSKASDNFEGCMAELVSNKSDFAFPPMKFLSNIPQIKQSSAFLSSKTVIGSAYNNTIIESDTNILDAFSSFSHGLWMLIFTSVFLFTGLIYYLFKHHVLHVKRMKTNRRKIKVRSALTKSIRISLGCLLKQHSSYHYWSKKLSVKRILFLFALFSFIIMFYFSSMIKTEMVVQKEPETITTYDDILSKNVHPFWLRQLDDHSEFENADSNSKEGKIWLLAKRYGMEESFVEQPHEVTRYVELVSHRKAVWLGPGYLMTAFIRNACPFGRMYHLHNDSNLLMRYDPSAQEHLMGLLYSKFMNPKFEKKFNQLAQVELEKGMIIKHLRLLDFLIAPEKGEEALRNCMANKIIYPESHIYSMHLRYYKNLFLMHVCIMLSGFFILLFEVVHSRFVSF